MHIVIFAHFAGSPEHGMVFGHYYLGREWTQRGHEVTIVAASFAHTRFRQPPQTGTVEVEMIHGIRYIWLPVPSYDPKSVLGRVKNIIRFTMQCHLCRLPLRQADIVICSSHHPFPIFAARRYAGKFHGRLVFEVRDLWPLTLIELGGAHRFNPFIALMQYAETYAYKHADKVVSVLPMAKEYMESKGMSPEKFVYIPNGATLDGGKNSEPLPVSHRQQLNQLRREDKFIIGYVGKIGLANALHVFIEALALGHDKQIVFVMLGAGACAGELMDQAARLNIAERVFILAPVNKNQVGSFLDYVDVAYIGLLKKSIFRFGVSPTKLNDFMLAAKPVISAIDAPPDIIRESAAGISCSPEDPDALCDAIRTMKNISEDERQEMGVNGFQWLQKNRDYRVLAKTFLLSVMENK